MAMRYRLFFIAIWALSPVQAEGLDPALPRSLDEARAWWNDGLQPTFTTPTSRPEPAKPADNRTEKRKTRLLQGAGRMVKQLALPLEIGGYSHQLRFDEEYRLDPIAESSRTLITFGDAFWTNYFRGVSPDLNHAEYSRYLLYVLLRAGADEEYLRHFDPERCAWNVQGDAENLTPSLRVLRRTIEAPPTSWLAPDGPVYHTNEAFRRALEPSADATLTTQALVRYGLTSMARRAADLYALEAYERTVGESPLGTIRRRVRSRERALAWEFGRARSAMTMAERMAFRKALHYAFDVGVSREISTVSRSPQP
jgi:hypothetical protein